MLIRIVFVPLVAMLVWWFSHNLLRPDDSNWVVWITTSDASKTSKTIWGLIAFAGTVAIGASLALFARRSRWAFAAVLAASYIFANWIGVGYHSTSGERMELTLFASLVLGMCSSYPLTFSEQIAGNQIDVVGDGK